MFAGDGSCRCGVKGPQRIVGGEEADVSLGQDGVTRCILSYLCILVLVYFHTCVYLCLLVVCEETDVWAR